MPILDLHTTAQDAEQVCNDLAFEDLGIVGLQTVEYLAPHWHNSLEFTVPGQLDAAQSRVALHDVELPAAGVPGPAVYKLLYPV